MLIGRAEVPRGCRKSALLDNRHLLVSNVCLTAATGGGGHRDWSTVRRQRPSANAYVCLIPDLIARLGEMERAREPRRAVVGRSRSGSTAWAAEERTRSGDHAISEEEFG